MRFSHPTQPNGNAAWWRRLICAIRTFFCGPELTDAQKACVAEMEKEYEKFKNRAGGDSPSVP